MQVPLSAPSSPGFLYGIIVRNPFKLAESTLTNNEVRMHTKTPTTPDPTDPNAPNGPNGPNAPKPQSR